MNKQTMTSQRTGVSTFASPTSPSAGQSLQKSFHLSQADKIELKKFPCPSENKKYATAQPNTKKTVKLNKDNGFQTRKTEHQQPTAVWRNGGCSASYDSFVQDSSAILRLNICAKNPPLRQAAKRWWQPYETDSATIDGVTIRRLMTVPVSVSSADFDVVFQRCAFCFSLVSGDSNSTSYGLC